MAEVTNTLGRRKTAVARLYMTPGKGEIIINGREIKEYFPYVEKLLDKDNQLWTKEANKPEEHGMQAATAGMVDAGKQACIRRELSSNGNNITFKAASELTADDYIVVSNTIIMIKRLPS